MKNRFKKLPTIILTLFILMTFIFTNLNSIAFARGSGSKSTPSRSISTPSKTSPKSGAKSGSFSSPKAPSSSDSQNSTTQPKSGVKSGSFSNSTKSSSSNSSGSNVSSSGSSWRIPTIIFWPHRSYYYDSYGISHYGYRSPSFSGILGDLILLIVVIALISWFIKRRRR